MMQLWSIICFPDANPCHRYPSSSGSWVSLICLGEYNPLLIQCRTKSLVNISILCCSYMLYGAKDLLAASTASRFYSFDGVVVGLSSVYKYLWVHFIYSDLHPVLDNLFGFYLGFNRRSTRMFCPVANCPGSIGNFFIEYINPYGEDCDIRSVVQWLNMNFLNPPKEGSFCFRRQNITCGDCGCILEEDISSRILEGECLEWLTVKGHYAG